MTIQEMFEREPIYSIIEKTLHEYYREVYKRDIDVKIQRKKFLQKFLIYPRLGVIVPVFPSKKVRREVYAWFDVQNNIARKIIAKTYIFLCFITFGLLSDASMILSDDSIFTNNMLIIPSNRKIRIYDFQTGIIDSVIKDGFNDFYFNNEIYVREEYDYPFILKIMKKGNRWYRERLLCGKGLVRIHPVEYNNFLDQVLNDLSMLYKNTRKDIKINEYCIKLGNKLKKSLEEVIYRKKIKCGERLSSLIDICLEIVAGMHETFPVVLAHGDLQNGNIHIDEDMHKAYIIDWETAEEKSIWYDSETLLCYTRRKGRFAQMINERSYPETKEKILFFDENKNRNMDAVAAVLLLEELKFYLDEMIDLPGEIGFEVIDRFIYELDCVNWSSLRA